MSDYLETLPSDKEPLGRVEKQLINRLCKERKQTFERLFETLKEPLLLGVIFFLLNTSPVTTTLKNVAPYARSSDLSLLCYTTALFVGACFILQNYTN